MIRFALILCLLLPSLVTAQEDTLSPLRAVITADIPVGAFAAIPDDSTLSAKAFRDEVAKGISEAAEKSTELSRLQKRRIDRVMRGGWFNESRKESVIDATIKNLYTTGAIAVTPDGVQAAIDWDNVLSFIEKLIPLIMQLVALFGG